MSNWKCPHCGTPQAESARCWACSRSPISCSTCRDFRRSVAGRLGYCGKDRTRAVLTGDEVRDCWQAEPATPEPFLGLFGSLEPPPPSPARTDAPRPAAPTAAVAAQRKWNQIVAGGIMEDPIAARGGSVAVAPRSVRERGTTTRPARSVPAWLEQRTSLATTGPLEASPAAPTRVAVPLQADALPVLGTLDVPHILDAEPIERPDAHIRADLATSSPAATPLPATIAAPGPAAPRPTAAAPLCDPGPETVLMIATDDGMPARTVTTWIASSPVAAAPSVSPDPVAPVTTRWRHPSIDERAATPAPAPAEPPVTDGATTRRSATLSLFPATLANRLRQRLGTRGLRAVAPPAGQAPTSASALPAAAPRERQPFATGRPSGPGRLVDAPRVPPVMSIGEQLRRAEQLRRERASLDGEGLRGARGRDPLP